MKKIILYIILTLVFFSGQAFSQSCDWSVIDGASRDYENGNFDKVIEKLTDCTQNGFNNRQKVQAYRLLAKTYLARDKDSLAIASVQKLLNLNPDFQPDVLSDNIIFIYIVEGMKKEANVKIITSVSKKAENLNQAPATVMLISEEDLKNRGYLDLEAVLHDLPGFDISRSNGNLYTHAYQRGYRSINTNRTLFLVDGIEENDLWSSNVYLSRQYSLTNVKNIEVIYGPASTMYGSNAFLGVLNVKTKNPTDYIEPGKIFGAHVRAGYGSFNTQFVDGTVAVQSKNNNIALSINARTFLSDEQNLSGYPEHDYAAKSILADGQAYHSVLDITNPNDASAFIANFPDPSTLYNYTNGQIILTDEGIQKAIDFDNAFLQNINYTDLTEAYSLEVKFKMYDFLIGMNYWSKAEGTGSQYNDLVYRTANEGGTWRPVHNYFFIKYEKDISDKLNISSFLRYKIHDFHPENSVVPSATYLNAELDLAALLNNVEPLPINVYLFQKSNQLREELKLLYQPKEWIDVVAGFEARFSAIQGDYTQTVVVGSTQIPDSIIAEQQGSSGTEIAGGNQFFSRDLGLYAQAGISFMPNLKGSFGLRFDNNLVRENEGYGNVFNPRFALVYSPQTFIFKAIYAEAFKDATNREKYSTSVGKRELPNPLLRPEKVKNVELAIGKSFFNNDLFINTSAYFSSYSDIIQEVQVQLENGSSTNQNQAKGQAEIYGINAFVDYKFNNFSAYANYTFTEPYTIKPTDSEGNILTDAQGNPYEKLRISDIASHQVNLGVNFLYKEVLNLNLRTNIVGERKTGENTTVPTNPETFEPYAVLNGAVSFTFSKLGLMAQLSAFNILDTEYFSPGLDYATGDLASKLHQNGRNLHLSLTYKF